MRARLASHTARFGSLAVATVFFVAACGANEPPPAISVDDVAYTTLDIRLLDTEEEDRLIDLTAFGLAVAKGELERFGAPMIEREEQRLVLQKLMTEVSAESIGMDDDALRRAYHDDPDWELEVRHIVILSERWRPKADRQEAHARAVSILERVESGEDFPTLAGTYSEEEGADRRGGLLEPGREGTWVREFWEAALELDEGETSGVVETEYGYHILKLEARRPVPFDEARPNAIGRLIDLAAAAGKADAWARRESSLIRVHVEDVESWRRGELPDTTVLASWPDGEYHGEEMRRRILALESDAYESLETADERTFRDELNRAARDALLVDRASELGIELDIAEEGSVRERWRSRAEGWANALGFEPGATPDEVRSVALSTVNEGAQDVQIARSELLEFKHALRQLYPVQRTEIDADTDVDSTGSVNYTESG